MKCKNCKHYSGFNGGYAHCSFGVYDELDSATIERMELGCAHGVLENSKGRYISMEDIIDEFNEIIEVHEENGRFTESLILSQLKNKIIKFFR